MTSDKKYSNRRRADPNYKHSKYNAANPVRVPFPIVDGLKCHNRQCLEYIVEGPGALIIKDGNPSVYCEGCKPVFGHRAGVAYFPVRFYYPRREADKKILKRYNSNK